MGSEFRYTLEKVLGTQDCPILRLASHRCVLNPNLIKNKYNTYVLNSHTHTHTHIMYLTNNMASLSLNKHTYLSTK